MVLTAAAKAGGDAVEVLQFKLIVLRHEAEIIHAILASRLSGCDLRCGRRGLARCKVSWHFLNVRLLSQSRNLTTRCFNANVVWLFPCCMRSVRMHLCPSGRPSYRRANTTSIIDYTSQW